MNYQNYPIVVAERANPSGSSAPIHFDPNYHHGPSGGGYESIGGLDFWGVFRTIYNRKFMILSIFILGLVIATIFSLRTTPMYKARTTIEIQKQEVQILEATGIDQPNVADAEYISTQFELIKSRALAERVAEQLDLPSDPRYADSEKQRPERLRQAAGIIVQNLRVSPVGRSRVINVEYISPYPSETARIANTLIETFIQSNLERRYNTTAYAREFLQERLTTTKALLEEKERELVEYANQADILELDNGVGGPTSLDVNSVISLNQALSEAESERIDAEQAYREARANSNVRDIVDNEALQNLRSQLSELQSEYEEKLSIYQPQFPEMQRLQTRISATQRLINIEVSSRLSALESDYRAAAAREDSLRSRVTQLTTALRSERDRRIEYTILQREVDTNRTQYDALLQRLKEISISSGIGTSQVSIIDEALIPTVPFEPNIIRSLLQAAILSLAIGVILAFALSHIDNTIKTPEDLTSKLGLKALGLIPISRHRNIQIIDHLHNPKSPILEAYHSARTAIDYASEEGTPKSILVTSTKPSEGKSSTVLALAMAYSGNEKRVLIIDADIRKSSFHADEDDSIGLSGLLRDDRESILDHILETGTDNVFLLPAGFCPPNPAELLYTGRLSQLISEAESLFDIVVVDSPPVLSFADAPLLGAACKGALIVLEAGNVRAPAAQRTLSRLYESRTEVIGAILTKFDSKHSAYDYGYYYSEYGKRDDNMNTPEEERRRITIATRKVLRANAAEESDS